VLFDTSNSTASLFIRGTRKRNHAHIGQTFLARRFSLFVPEDLQSEKLHSSGPNWRTWRKSSPRTLAMIVISDLRPSAYTRQDRRGDYLGADNLIPPDKFFFFFFRLPQNCTQNWRIAPPERSAEPALTPFPKPRGNSLSFELHLKRKTPSSGSATE